MEQRTEEWYLARKGKMTASEMYLLLGTPRSKTETFTDSCKTWLKGKVSELYMSDAAFMEDCENKAQSSNRAMQHGTFYEDEARNEFIEHTGIAVEQVGFLPLQGHELWAGGSPDGIGEDGSIIEIKCPWNSDRHFDYFLFNDAKDLKAYSLQYYTQMQVNMMVTDTDHGWFVSFDPRIAPNFALKILRVPIDHELCETLSEREEIGEKWMIERMDAISQMQKTMSV